jgi:hypothetical protein
MHELIEWALIAAIVVSAGTMAVLSLRPDWQKECWPGIQSAIIQLREDDLIAPLRSWDAFWSIGGPDIRVELKFDGQKERTIVLTKRECHRFEYKTLVLLKLHERNQ